MKTNPKSLLIYFFSLNFLFLILYTFIFKSILLENIKSTQDESDYNFYFGIFNNLEIAIIVFLLFMLLVILFWNKIRNFINSITDVKRFFVLILLLVAAVKIFLLIFVQTIPFSDAELYVNLARRLFETSSYLNSRGDYSVYFPVGYPFILSLFYYISSDTVLIAKIFNIFIFSGTLVILYSLFKTHLNKNQLVIFLITFAFLPNNLFSSNVLMTDYLFLFAAWLILYLFLKYGNSYVYLILIGILIGLAAYIRPLALIFPILFLIYFVKIKSGKSSFLKFGLIIIFMVLTILPWAYRNYNLFGSIIPVSANTGVNFLIGNHANSNGGYNFDTSVFPDDKSEVIEDRMAFQKGMDEIWNNPGKSILRIPVKIFKAYYRFDSSFIWSFKQTSNYISPVVLSTFFYFSNTLFFLIIFFNVIYAFKYKVSLNLRLNYLLLLFFLYTILLIVIFFGSDRFIIPFIPIHIYLFSKYFFRHPEKYELS